MTTPDSIGGSGEGLIERLGHEADLCRNDGADDIAALIDEAREALIVARETITIERDHLVSCCTVNGDRSTLEEGAEPDVRRMERALALIDKGAKQ